MYAGLWTVAWDSSHERLTPLHPFLHRRRRPRTSIITITIIMQCGIFIIFSEGNQCCINNSVIPFIYFQTKMVLVIKVTLALTLDVYEQPASHLLLKDDATIHFLLIMVINLSLTHKISSNFSVAFFLTCTINYHLQTYPYYNCLTYPQFSLIYEWETKCQGHFSPNLLVVLNDQRAVNSQKGYLPILSKTPHI